MAYTKEIVPKSAERMVERLRADLTAFGKESGAEFPTLFEADGHMFEIRNPRLFPDGTLKWEDENGFTQSDNYLYYWDDDRGDYYPYEKDVKASPYFDPYEEFKGLIGYWRAALRRAKRYWQMDAETLDRVLEEGDQTDDETANNDNE